MLRRRYAIAMSTAVTTILTLSACGGGGGGGGGEADDGGKPSQATSSPSGAGPSGEPATPSEIMRIYRTVHGLSSTPVCNHVPWDDAGCGEDLTAAEDVADAMSRHIEKHFPGGEYADVKKSAGRVVRTVNTLRKLGCYRLSPKPPKTDPAKLRDLCPTLGTIAALSWLNFETSVSGSER